MVQRFLYRALSGFVARHKGVLAVDDLSALALWLMYHPEAGVLPCDGWRLADPPLTRLSTFGLRFNHFRDDNFRGGAFDARFGALASQNAV